MKLLVLFFVAVVWLHLPAESDANQYIDKRAIFYRNYEPDTEQMTASEYLMQNLKNLFSTPGWRKMQIMLANQELMQDPDFRNKWSITEEDEQMKEDEELKLSAENVAKISSFIQNGTFRALVALTSTKEELLNPKYRQYYNMGVLTDEVKNSDQGGNFFEGPQWKEFLNLTGIHIDENVDDWVKYNNLKAWVMKIDDDF